jgi:phosphoglycolate phosphatase-like HAD superfamily hydrolase
MDDVLGNTGFTQSMLIGYQPGKQEWWKRYYNIFTKGKMPFGLQSYETGDVVGQEFEDFYNSTNGTTGVSLNAQQVIDKNNNADIAMEKARRSLKDSKKLKKIRIFDFDDTLAQSKSMVIVNMPDGSSSRINATEFAKDASRLESEGAVFDFAEFSKVVEGKKGPLFDVAKKIADARGSEDLFVLTARPQDAAGPIQEFLASVGLNIPLQNITGLADGKAQAKADWVINKFAEGYNDFYFTDDATKNVKAVKDALDVLDVKSRVQIARVKFQKDLDFEFNKMIERNKGIKAEARYSQVVAQRLGKNKKRFNLFFLHQQKTLKV